jgi:hypothetical protein
MNSVSECNIVNIQADVSRFLQGNSDIDQKALELFQREVLTLGNSDPDRISAKLAYNISRCVSTLTEARVKTLGDSLDDYPRIKGALQKAIQVFNEFQILNDSLSELSNLKITELSYEIPYISEDKLIINMTAFIKYAGYTGGDLGDFENVPRFLTGVHSLSEEHFEKLLTGVDVEISSDRFIEEDFSVSGLLDKINGKDPLNKLGVNEFLCVAFAFINKSSDESLKKFLKLLPINDRKQILQVAIYSGRSNLRVEDFIDKKDEVINFIQEAYEIKFDKSLAVKLVNQSEVNKVDLCMSILSSDLNDTELLTLSSEFGVDPKILKLRCAEKLFSFYNNKDLYESPSVSEFVALALDNGSTLSIQGLVCNYFLSKGKISRAIEINDEYKLDRKIAHFQIEVAG